jgi:hypothetical protein
MINPDCGKCSECPVVLGILEVAERYSDMARETDEQAMDLPIDEISQSMFGQVAEARESGAVVLDPITMSEITEPADIAASMRMQSVQFSEDLDGQAERAKHVAQEMANICQEGPLKMRAKRAGRTITVTVCANSLQPDGTLPHEPTVVHRG